MCVVSKVHCNKGRKVIPTFLSASHWERWEEEGGGRGQDEGSGLRWMRRQEKAAAAGGHSSPLSWRRGTEGLCSPHLCSHF